jgi:DNA-directed RNA polymerase specialized sigma24 family protein
LAIDNAIESLETESPECVQVVKLRFFAGLSIEETSAAMGISPSTAKRHWAFSRAWLFDALRDDDSPSNS